MMRLLFLIGLLSTMPGALAEPVRLIFDTDMGNDVDDLIALCMIHSLQKRGACKLLAVTITKDHPQAAAFVDAVNTFMVTRTRPLVWCMVAQRGRQANSTCSPMKKT
jgi:hypothetical protein